MNKFICIESNGNEHYVVGDIYYFEVEQPKSIIEFFSLSFKNNDYKINGQATFKRIS